MYSFQDIPNDDTLSAILCNNQTAYYTLGVGVTVRECKKDRLNSGAPSFDILRGVKKESWILGIDVTSCHII
jgi:hypothetical protein